MHFKYSMTPEVDERKTYYSSSKSKVCLLGSRPMCTQEISESQEDENDIFWDEKAFKSFRRNIEFIKQLGNVWAKQEKFPGEGTWSNKGKF